MAMFEAAMACGELHCAISETWRLFDYAGTPPTLMLLSCNLPILPLGTLYDRVRITMRAMTKSL